MARIAFILGKPVRPNTIFPEVFDRLRANGATITVHVPSVGDPFPSAYDAPDLLVQRGLGADALEYAHGLEKAGARFCNSVAATIDVADRALVTQTLARHGLPVPNTTRVDTWQAVRKLAPGQPLVVKVADGSVGRGQGVLISEAGALPPEPPFPGPFIVQDFIAGDGDTCKIYVAGSESRGLIKRWPPRQPSDSRGVPFAVDVNLAELAQRVGVALNLEIFGLDIITGPSGPVIIDVNPFPGFRGVPQAARLVSGHLINILHDESHNAGRYSGPDVSCITKT